MSKLEKLRGRFLSQPKDFTWEELVRMLSGFGYVEFEGDGSRKCFRADGLPTLRLHKPHPSNVVKRYVMRQLKDTLKAEGLL